MLGDSSPGATLVLGELETMGPRLALQIQAITVKTVDEFESAVAAASRGRAQALIFNGALFQAERVRIAELALNARLPSLASERSYVEVGTLMSYGEDRFDLWRRSATFVDRILRGAKPAELPVEEPRIFELVVNLKTARTLGLTTPSSLASRVTEWLQ